MKKKHWIFLVLIVAALAFLKGYQIWDQFTTDTTPPVITVDENNLAVSVEDPHSALMQGIQAVDDRDGDVTKDVIIEHIGSITEDHQVTVTYAAFDAAGNVSKAQRVVTYSDYRSPRFSLTQPLCFPYGSNFEVMDLLGADDNLDGNIRHRIKATLLSDSLTAAEGIHEVMVQVSNSLGDTVVLTLPVEIYSAGRYNAKLTLSDYLIYLPQGDSFDAKNYLENFTYLGKTTSLKSGVTDGIRLQTNGVVDTQTPGVYCVSYTVSCQVGEQVHTGYSKLIVIVEGQD